MYLNSNDFIIKKASRLIREHGTRDPYALVSDLGITIIEKDFTEQKGAYVHLERNSYIFLKRDLPEPMKSIVILHEIGHDRLHRDISKTFKEFSLFDTTNNTMEFEANLFASQIMIPDKEFIDYLKQGFSAAQIAASMNTDINLIAIKADDMKRRGYDLRIPDHKRNFL